MAGGLAVFVTAAVFVGRVVTDTAATGVRRVFLGRLPPAVTPNEAFYTVSKNFFDPEVDGDTGACRSTGWWKPRRSSRSPSCGPSPPRRR